MTLTQWTAIQRGRALQLARALGITPPVVSDWCTGKKRVPFEQCMPIETATQGAVTRRDLRPDDWQKHWPELADSEPDTPPALTPPAQAAIENIAKNDIPGGRERRQRQIEQHPDLERRAPLAAKLAGQGA